MEQSSPLSGPLKPSQRREQGTGRFQAVSPGLDSSVFIRLSADTKSQLLELATAQGNIPLGLLIERLIFQYKPEDAELSPTQAPVPTLQATKPKTALSFRR